jgi:hypothetical protein
MWILLRHLGRWVCDKAEGMKLKTSRVKCGEYDWWYEAEYSLHLSMWEVTQFGSALMLPALEEWEKMHSSLRSARVVLKEVPIGALIAVMKSISDRKNVASEV